MPTGNKPFRLRGASKVGNQFKGKVFNTLATGFGIAGTLVAASGTYAATGNDVTFAIIRAPISAVSGTYNITGRNVTLPITKSALSAVSGTYNITGRNVTFQVSKILVLANGTYFITGRTINLPITRSPLAITNGVYTISGNNSSLLRIMLINSGTYSDTGNPITFQSSKIFLLPSGNYSITGSDLITPNTPSDSTQGQPSYQSKNEGGSADDEMKLRHKREDEEIISLINIFLNGLN